MKEQIFQIGVKSLIKNKDGKFLITKGRSYNYWDIPGGRMDKDESIQDTLKRELKEELGIKVKMLGLHIAVISKIKIKAGKDLVGLMLLIYDCKLPAGVRLVSRPEYDEFKWVDKKEIIKRLGNKFPKEFFESL